LREISPETEAIFFGRIVSHLKVVSNLKANQLFSLPTPHAGILLGLFLNPEEGDDTFF
jgi:hypothetical protein